MTDKDNKENIYLSVGICGGIVIGILMDRMAIGISFGILFGVIADTYFGKSK